MRRAQFAQSEVEAREEERGNDGTEDDEPDDANGSLPLYSSGAMVTRRPASSSVNSI